MLGMDDARSGAVLKRLSAMVVPRYSVLLDQVLTNARVSAWIRRHAGIPTFRQREELFAFVHNEFIRDEAVDYLEFGVMHGGSMRTWADLNRHPESRFFGFDTFTGLPEDWGWVAPAGAFSCDGKLPDIDDPRVSFVTGLFQESLPGFLRTFRPRSRLVIHHDADLYSATLYCLTMLHGLSIPGSLHFFDEFSSPLHEFRAIEDYCSSYRARFRALGMTGNFAQQAAFLVE